MLLHSLVPLGLTLATLSSLAHGAVKVEAGAPKLTNCPYSVASSTLEDGSIEFTYSAKNASFPSIGSNVPKEQNSGACTVELTLELTPNRKVTFKGVEVEAPLELDNAVEASVNADFLWVPGYNLAKVNTPTITGPKTAAQPSHFNITKTSDSNFQVYCALSGPYASEAQNYTAANLDPIVMSFVVRTQFDLKGSGSGSFGKAGASIKQIVRLGYSEPCPDTRHDEKAQKCWIDRFDTYLCTCGDGKPRLFGPCEKWTQFPPLPFLYK